MRRFWEENNEKWNIKNDKENKCEKKILKNDELWLNVHTIISDDFTKFWVRKL